MDDIRDEQWASRTVRRALGEVPAPVGLERSLGERLRRAREAGPSRRARAMSLAAFAGTAIALTTVLLVSIAMRNGADNGRSTAPSRTDVTAAAAPASQAAQPNNVPADPTQRFFYYAAPTQAAGSDLILHVVDWTGGDHGTIAVATKVSADTAVGPLTVTAVSPDGRRLLVSTGDVLDQGGEVVGRLDPSLANGSKLWADDGTHVCAVDDPLLRPVPRAGTASASVDLLDVNGKARQVTVIGRFDKRSDVLVLACSVAQDLVVLAQRGPDSAGGVAYTDLWAVRLSSGAMLAHRTFSGRPFVVSPNGRFLAEAPDPGTGAPADVVSLPDMARVADLGGAAMPTAFSADGSRLLVTDGGMTRLVDWGSGLTVWQMPTYKTQVTAVADAGSMAMVLAVGGQSPRMVLVTADGAVRPLGSGQRVLMFGLSSAPEY